MIYIALGDSISIDDYAGGAGCGAASLLFRNKAAAFPEWVGRDLLSRFPDARFGLLATDGATAATVRYAQIPRLKDADIRPTLVTLTMGGNDLLQTFGMTGAAHAARRALWDHAHAVLADLRHLAEPNAVIVLGTIYDPSDGTGDGEGLGIPGLWPDALEMLAAFNETIRAVAGEYDALVADLHGHFLGHGLRAGDPSQTDPRPRSRDLWYCGVVEPNFWGASATRRVFWETLERAGVLPL